MSDVSTTPAKRPTPRKVPRPAVAPETAAYWQAANEGRLLIKHCRTCNQHHHYPRDICPLCLSDDTEWRTAAGTGTVYSHSRVAGSAGAGDHVMAFVSLDEGPTVMTNLVDGSDWHIGQRVRVVFVPSEGGQAVPMFTGHGATGKT